MSEPRFMSSAQQGLLEDAVDEILAKVFQGQKDHLREQMLHVVAKLSRKHPWPYFEECVAAEAVHRVGGGEPRNWMQVAVTREPRKSSLKPVVLNAPTSRPDVESPSVERGQS